MGSSFGVAVFGAILNNRLAYHLPRLLPAGATLGLDQRSLVSSPAAIRRLPPAVHDGVIEALSRSIHVTFLWAIPLLAVAFFVTFLLKETPLRTTAHLTVSSAADPEVIAFDADAGAGAEKVSSSSSRAG
jgi:hypothetical protein